MVEPKIFKATEALGFIITVADYKKAGLYDIPEVVENRETIKKTFDMLGISEVIECTDGTRQEYLDKLKKVYERIESAHKSQGARKLLLFIYIAGHGVMLQSTRTTHFVFNEVDEKSRYVSLE
jgi:hypothetical protein